MLPSVLATTTQYVDSVALFCWTIASTIGSVAVIWVIALVIQCARELNVPERGVRG